MGLATLTGQPMCITPEIENELIHQIIRISNKNVVDQLSSRYQLRESDKRKVEDSIFRSLTEWKNEYLLAQQSPIQCVGANEEFQMRARMLAQRFPSEPRIFFGPNAYDYTGDLKIISEALAVGADLVLTNNHRSIGHSNLNRWVIASGLRNETFLYSGPAGVEKILGDKFTEYCHLASIYMTVSEEVRSRDEDFTIWDQFRNALAENLENCADAIWTEEFSSEQSVARWESARAGIAEEKWIIARTVETSRQRAIRNSIRDAGWTT